MKNIDALFAFIRERYAIYERRARGEKKPWTRDPILQKYRFTNVYRELDTTTAWISTNWRTPHQDDPDLWFAMVVARLVNWPETLGRLGYPVPWTPKHFIRTIEGVRAGGSKAFGSAYIVSTNGIASDKVGYLSDNVLAPLWADRKLLRPEPGAPLQAFFTKLLPYNGMGEFMVGQVVADIKYAEPYRTAPDWWTFVASGPGSRRGLNYVYGRRPDHPWGGEEGWKKAFYPVYDRAVEFVAKAGMPGLHAQDLQNCLCEFSKYCRVRDGGTPPRQRYPGLP